MRAVPHEPDQARPEDDRPGDGRDETTEERLDRNWDELLQELRITQTGLQLLSGFLLTLAFTQRFAELEHWQAYLYLALVVIAAVAVGLNLTPVMLHRRLFGEHVKERVVAVGHVVSQVVIALVALLVTGTAALIFAVVLDETAAIVVGIALVVVLAALLGALPQALDRSSRATGHPPDGDHDEGHDERHHEGHHEGHDGGHDGRPGRVPHHHE